MEPESRGNPGESAMTKRRNASARRPGRAPAIVGAARFL
jgi:hypothetical protein